ncbi:uncharacterized protein UTRI_00524 [Ustilago trichophora]|uniref:Uncharacterized protein n=1 Tax=Ustilago trichophora TaxID=86804 RepID=A0A5C3DUE0_9BASI|nr:uncharacterized protein UTRI_00524 [Ustilago trichophora]
MVRTTVLAQFSLTTLLFICTLLFLSIPATVNSTRRTQSERYFGSPERHRPPQVPARSRQFHTGPEPSTRRGTSAPNVSPESKSPDIHSPEVHSPELEAAAKKSKGFLSRLFT